MTVSDSIDYSVVLGQIEKLLNNYYKNKKTEFIPGKTIIPLISPSYGKEEVLESLESLLSTWVTAGKKVRKFEKDFARYIGTKFAVMVNSGSSANLLALSILSNPQIKKIKKHNEIITPAVTWATTVYPIINVGATPLFVDVDSETYTINTDLVESAISKKTSVLMPVHLIGNTCDMRKLGKLSKSYNLTLIEDSCEAHGATYYGKKAGSFGDISTFSFFMSHHITTIEGGMLLTNNENYYELAKSIRAFGWTRDLINKKNIANKYKFIDENFLFINLGFNIRPTEIQGAFGIHQLKKINKFLKIRRDNAKYWQKRFRGLKDLLILPKATHGARHSYFCFPLTIKDEAPFNRESIMKFLNKRKIETRSIMAGNMVEQPSMKKYEYKIHNNLKNSERIMRRGFFFGSHQDIDKDKREFIADSILDFVNENTNK